MLKISKFFIIVTTNFYYGKKRRISFESYMIFMRVRNQKTIINNEVRAIEQIFVIDFFKQTNHWVNLKQMLHILTIMVRQIKHVCILNLKKSKNDAQQDYLSKKGVNLVIILGFAHFAF